MDLTLQSEAGDDVMVISPEALDNPVEVGGDRPELTFELKMPRHLPEMRAGCTVYAEGTDWGGMLRSYSSDGHTWVGDTWAGMLASRVLVPDGGSGALTLSGDTASIVSQVVSRCDLAGLFSVDAAQTAPVGTWTFDKYADAWTGLVKMLRSKGMKLRVRHDGRKAVLSTVPLVDWTLDQDFDSTLVEVRITRDSACVNHLVGRGEGQDGERVAVDLYLDRSGNVSKKKTFSGRWERAEYYDYTTADAERLEEDGTKRLKDYWAKASSVKVSLLDGTDRFDVGDKVGGTDPDTGESASAYVSKKIVKVDRTGKVEVEYETGGY